MIALTSYHGGIAFQSNTTQLLIIIIVTDERGRLTIYANITRLSAFSPPILWKGAITYIGSTLDAKRGSRYRNNGTNLFFFSNIHDCGYIMSSMKQGKLYPMVQWIFENVCILALEIPYKVVRVWTWYNLRCLFVICINFLWDRLRYWDSVALLMEQKMSW
jgi:hypothetical protein